MKYFKLLSLRFIIFVLFSLAPISLLPELQAVDSNVNCLTILSGKSIAGQTTPGSQSLSDELVSQFRNAKTVRIVIDLSFKEAQNVEMPIRELTEGLLSKYVALRIVKTGGDLIFRVNASGKALSASYMGVGTQYSGAQLTGEISLEIPGKASYEKPFENFRTPGKITSSSRPTPTSAPFWEIVVFNEPYEGGFIQASVKLLSEIYGTDFLKGLLKRRRPSVMGEANFCAYSIIELARLNNKDAIKQISELLETWDDDALVINEAINALLAFADSSSAVSLVNFLKRAQGPFYFEAVGNALVKIGRPSIEPLIKYLREEQIEGNRNEAWKILEAIAKEKFGRDLDELEKWWEKNKKQN